MAHGVERTVRMGSMAYLDADGVSRRAECGAVVQVHPSNVERFDRLNVLAGEEPSVPEPTPRRRRTRKTED